MKRLLLFDIDGTLTNTTSVGDRCFVQAFRNCYDLHLSDTDWSNYTHVTDIGLATEIIERAYNRSPETGELDAFEAEFCQLLFTAFDQNAADFEPVPGAVELIASLRTDERYTIAFATGGYRQAAEFKLKRAGISFANSPFASCNNHYSRAGLVKSAIEQALAQNEAADFEQMAYIGDGAWDLRLSNEFGMAFLGVDVHATGKLQKLGASTVINDFLPLEKPLLMLDRLFAAL